MRYNIDSGVAAGVAAARNEREIQQRIMESHVEQRAKILESTAARHARREKQNRP